VVGFLSHGSSPVKNRRENHLLYGPYRKLRFLREEKLLKGFRRGKLSKKYRGKMA
jgi:hypothetical protein